MRLGFMAAALVLALGVAALARDDQNEMPDKLVRSEQSFDYVRREAEIPMRDGVKLHTVIFIPRGAHHVGIVLTRTPYSADEITSHSQSSHLA